MSLRFNVKANNESAELLTSELAFMQSTQPLLKDLARSLGHC